MDIGIMLHIGMEPGRSIHAALMAERIETETPILVVTSHREEQRVDTVTLEEALFAFVKLYPLQIPLIPEIVFISEPKTQKIKKQTTHLLKEKTSLKQFEEKYFVFLGQPPPIARPSLKIS